MLGAYFRALKAAFLASSLLPIVTAVCSLINAEGWTGSAGFWVKLVLAGSAVFLANAAFGILLRRFRSQIDLHSAEQVVFLERLPVRWVDGAIVLAAALSLFLELAVIRWQSAVFELFAFYKNFSLLACFAGLGLGYALARRDRLTLLLVMPLLAWQMLLMTGLRYGMPSELTASLRVIPFSEQLNMGVLTVTMVSQQIAIYSLLVVSFLLTALAFIPIGQLCGSLMELREGVRAYGLNLLGSFAGVVLMFLASYLWTPPIIWFAVNFAAMICFLIFDRRPLALSTASFLTMAVVLAWPNSTGWEKIYSPYQLLERGQDEWGSMVVSAGGHFYQRVHDLSRLEQATGWPNQLAHFYQFPYRIRGRSPGRIAIVGSGTGNDVAAALRNGAESVDAIEIDPAIMELGNYHPERPYRDTRVTRVVNDARTFLRTTRASYDMVVYGLLDSHTLLSHGSSVRIDSFVYTVEGLREARARLNEGGVLSLSFGVMTNEIGKKLYLMMEKAFDGHPPVCIKMGESSFVAFLQNREGNLAVPESQLAATGLTEISSEFANPALQADLSTDDWPFFYMPRRIYPTSYLIALALILLLSISLIGNFVSAKPATGQAAFFFLGAGFMLVETKGITEAGLAFGNTWHVIGIVIAGILAMAFLANLCVQQFKLNNLVVPYFLLMASLVGGWLIAQTHSFSPTTEGRLGTLAVLVAPIFFSGIAFSTLLRSSGGVSGAMAANVLGALCGGLLEYNSMYFGFQSLYLLAIGLYLVAFVFSVASRSRVPAAGVAGA